MASLGLTPFWDAFCSGGVAIGATGGRPATLLGSIGEGRGEQSELRASFAKWLGSIDEDRGEQDDLRASFAKWLDSIDKHRSAQGEL